MTCLVVEAGKVIIDVRGAILHLTPTEALTLYTLLGNAVNPTERVTATLDRGEALYNPYLHREYIKSSVSTHA